MERRAQNGKDARDCLRRSGCARRNVGALGALQSAAENIGLVENLPATEKLAAGGFQGTNDSRKIGYDGPCPPSGTHHYYFKIYALDSELPLKAGATKADLAKAMEGHIVVQGQLMGTYGR